MKKLSIEIETPPIYRRKLVYELSKTVLVQYPESKSGTPEAVTTKTTTAKTQTRRRTYRRRK
ncbi:MAG: hypothetical protein ACTSXJ_02015 [Candidatus Baldrarchaeia archaeon]